MMLGRWLPGAAFTGILEASELVAIVARKVLMSARRVGAIETARLCLSKRHYLREFTPAARRAKREPDGFDRLYGVRTSAIIDLSEIGIRDDYVHGHRHQPSPPDRFRTIVGGLSIDHAAFTFTDIGSGLGRALLLAAEYPFRAIVGVECSPELYSIAAENVRRYRAAVPTCPPVSLLCMNAADYIFPDEPVVLYLYNPFDDTVLRRVLRNLERSLARCPRDVCVVYYWPKHATVLDASPALAPVETAADYRVYGAASGNGGPR
jgi:hypothetical protein